MSPSTSLSRKLTTGRRPPRNKRSPRRRSLQKPNPRKGCACSCRRCSARTTSSTATSTDFIRNGENNDMKRFMTRRQILQDAGVGFGAMALNSILQQQKLFGAETAGVKKQFYDLKPKAPMFPAAAKRV